MNPYLEALYEIARLIAPSLLSVLVGALLIQRFFVSRGNEADFIDALIEELDALREHSLDYWASKSKQDDKKSERDILAAKIKGDIKILSSDIEYYYLRYCCKRKADMDRMLGEIADACSGGNFESKSKAIDTSRYMIVINAISRLKSDLLRRKL